MTSSLWKQNWKILVRNLLKRTGQAVYENIIGKDYRQDTANTKADLDKKNEQYKTLTSQL